MSEQSTPPPANPAGATDWKLVISALGLGLSLIGLGLSLYSMSLSRQAYRNTEVVRAEAVVREFLRDASSNPTAERCFEYLAGQPADQVRRLFAENYGRVPIANAEDEPRIRGCLNDLNDEERFDGHALSRRQVDQIRRAIINKLNAYDLAFTAIESGGLDAATVCRTVWPSYDSADEFVRQMAQMSPRPEEFQNLQTEYAANLRFVGGGACPALLR
jgi:hypothetical protein